jgi:chromate transporter
VLFIALLGWNVGMNAGGGVAAGATAWPFAGLGVLLAMIGILVPSTTLTFAAARWGHQNRELRSVRAFKQGMAPIVIALLVATGWILAASHGSAIKNWPLWLLTAITALLVWRTRLHMLWLLAAGGLLGWFGWV